MNYMVMECHPGYAVVLDENGQFLKVANLHYQPGQTVVDVIEMRQSEQVRKKSHKWLYSLGAAAACLVLMISTFLPANAAYASVYMKINPEVCIDVTQQDQVVHLSGINEDGKTLIEEYDYKKKSLDTVMDELVKRAIALGYLHEGGKITLTLDAEDEAWVVQHNESIPEQLSQKLGVFPPVEIEIKDKTSDTTLSTTTTEDRDEDDDREDDDLDDAWEDDDELEEPSEDEDDDVDDEDDRLPHHDDDDAHKTHYYTETEEDLSDEDDQDVPDAEDSDASDDTEDDSADENDFEDEDDQDS